MSMLSAQCDELRAMAESVGLAMPQAATLMMEAADALDSLDLALDSKRIAERRVTKLLTDNAKLRELVRELWPFVKAGWIHACPSRECCLFEECDADSEYECLIEEHMAGRMRELGIEVDE